MKEEKNKYEIANENLYSKILLISGVILLLFIIIVVKPFEDKLPIWNQEMLKSEYIGTVSKKYIDKDNHAAKIIELKNQKGKIHFWYFREYYNLIEIGDSISKMKNDSMFYIIKKEKSIVFKYQVGRKK